LITYTGSRKRMVLERRAPTKMTILRTLKVNRTGLTPLIISLNTGIAVTVIRSLISNQLMSAGLVEKVAHGVYKITLKGEDYLHTYLKVVPDF
jgi:predicted transcriptional regulator